MRRLLSLVAWWLIPGLAATIIVGLLTLWIWGTGIHWTIKVASLFAGFAFTWLGWDFLVSQMLKHEYKGIIDPRDARVTAVANTVMGVGLWLIVGIVVLAAITIPSLVVVVLIGIAGLAVGIAALAICQI